MEPVQLPQAALQRLRPLIQKRDDLAQMIETYIVGAADALEVDLQSHRLDPQKGAFVPVAEPQD